jgi:outer membrane protein
MIKLNKAFFFTFILFLTIISYTNGQNQDTQHVKLITLSELITLAANNSPYAKIASAVKEERYWTYKLFKANFLPQLGFEGGMPNFNRSIIPVTQNDGSKQFRPISLAENNIGLTLTQNIGLTGGTVTFGSHVQRIDNFLPYRNYQYNGIPANIRVSQPILKFNSLLWSKRLEPIKFEQSQKAYNEAIEQVSVDATDLFFKVLLSQIDLDIAKKNVANNDTLFRVAQDRYKLGKVAENELLQIELGLMRALQNKAEAELNLKNSYLELKIFLGILHEENFRLNLPLHIPDYEVEEALAVHEAKNNREKIMELQIQKLEAERDIVKAKREGRVNAQLDAGFGLTQQASIIGDIYLNPLNQQFIGISLHVPILDWGRSKSQIGIATARQEAIRLNIKIEEQKLEQEIIQQVDRFKMLKSQLKVAQKADEIADKRFEISKKRYMVGKNQITDLNIATQERDEAKRIYINTLREFWLSHYRLRQATLYDFENQKRISFLNE